MATTITIAARFNGPRESGNGGYSAGLLAAAVGGPAVVSLRSPVPLDRPLDVVVAADGVTRALDGDVLVMEAQPAEALDLEPPRAVTVAEARAAEERYRGLDDGPFSRCFVCGRARDDAFGVFAGRLDGDGLVATTWTPDGRAAGDDGMVAPEFVWSVLDCPTYFALYDDPATLSFLASLQVRIDANVRVGAEHVVVAWPIGRDGRKHLAGGAVLSADGATLAVGRALLIAARG
ncbi:MAG: hypothetical protein R2691_09345 [Solirubrobacterales bacterium]